MVVADARDAADERLRVVGAVPPPPEPRLQHRPLAPRAHEADQRERGQLLKGRRAADRLCDRPDDVEGLDDLGLGGQLTVDTDTLTEAMEVRAREEADAPSGARAQHRVAQGRRRAFSIGARNVHHLELAHRLAEQLEHLLEALPVRLRVLVPLREPREVGIVEDVSHASRVVSLHTRALVIRTTGGSVGLTLLREEGAPDGSDGIRRALAQHLLDGGRDRLWNAMRAEPRLGGWRLRHRGREIFSHTPSLFFTHCGYGFTCSVRRSSSSQGHFLCFSSHILRSVRRIASDVPWFGGISPISPKLALLMSPFIDVVHGAPLPLINTNWKPAPRKKKPRALQQPSAPPEDFISGGALTSASEPRSSTRDCCSQKKSEITVELLTKRPPIVAPVMTPGPYRALADARRHDCLQGQHHPQPLTPPSHAAILLRSPVSGTVHAFSHFSRPTRAAQPLL